MYQDNFTGIGITHGFDLPKHTFYDYCPKRYNRFKGYDLNVQPVDVRANNLGGPRLDMGLTVPVIVKQNRNEVWVDYQNGDAPKIFYRNYAAARKAALEWLGDRYEVTENQLNELRKKEIAKQIAEKAKDLERLEQWIENLKVEIQELGEEFGTL
jgi:hypothetical protein